MCSDCYYFLHASNPHFSRAQRKKRVRIGCAFYAKTALCQQYISFPYYKFPAAMTIKTKTAIAAIKQLRFTSLLRPYLSASAPRII